MQLHSSTPCPRHPASLSTSIHYVPIQASLLLPPPWSVSCHHGPVRSHTVRTAFHRCKCHLSYTRPAFHRRPFIRHPFKKDPRSHFMFSHFYYMQRGAFSTILTRSYNNIHIFFRRMSGFLSQLRIFVLTQNFATGSVLVCF